MVYFSKPNPGAGGLQAQKDHFWRMQDICFRHLGSAFSYHNEQTDHKWIINIPNDDPRYGRSEYLKALTQLDWARSAGYTHAIAAIVFAQAWVLSAVNYYCQNDPSVLGKKFKSPEQLAKSVGADKALKEAAKRLRIRRNEALHLYEGEHADGLTGLDCFEAYRHTNTSWLLFEGMLRKFGIEPDDGAWEIQTSRFSLPGNLEGLGSFERAN